jgi:putative DNA primase/helicase
MTRKRQREARQGPLVDDNSPTPQEVYLAAKAYIQSGLSLIPIRTNATKMPAIELLPKVWSEDLGRYRRPWGGYRQKPPTLEEVRAWFKYGGGIYGLAILAGAVSGGLEILDLDSWDVVEPWMKKVRRRSPGLLDKLVQVKTPRPGLHLYYRCEAAAGNQKLARIPVTDSQTGKLKPKTIVETKGEGGYCLAPPSPAACHPSGRCYTIISTRDLTQIPTISPGEREVLLDCARALNVWQAPRRLGYQRRPHKHGRFLRPGDDFAARADWADILEPHGWVWNGPGGDNSDY